MEARKIFNDELNRLRQNILAMAVTVEENLGRAISVMRNQDVDLVEEVRENDMKVDAYQIRIEDETAMLIATQQPVARDLREMVTIFKLTNNIERIGDHAVHLARAAGRLVKKRKPIYGAHEQWMQASMEKMAQTGQIMIRTAIEAYVKQDAQIARDAAAMDDGIDREHKALTEYILKVMKKNPRLVKTAYKILHASSQLERLGDHITNICEAIVYMTEGKHEGLNA